jgi:hypothetical protein
MIRMFCKGLPFELSRVLFTEYRSRKREIDYLVSHNSTYYKRYIDNFDTVYLILAMSIYYKRVIAQLDAVSTFQNSLRERWKIGVTRIGNTLITSEDEMSLRNICSDFQRIMTRFNLPIWLFDWSDSVHFLRNIVTLKDYLERLDRDIDE